MQGRLDDPEEVLLAWTGIGGRGRDTATTTGMRAVWRNGMFAQKGLMLASTLVALPGAQVYPNPEQLTFLPWLAIAGAAVQPSGLSAGQSVAVIGGSGQLGGAAVLVALAKGASAVVAVGRNAVALQRIAQVSPRVIPVLATGDRDADADAIVAARGEVDVVIDALGAAPTAEFTMAGYDSLRPEGTMVLLGGVRATLPIPYGDLLRRRITIRGSWMSPQQVVLDVWRMVRNRTVDLDSQAIQIVNLDDPDQAVQLASHSSGLSIVSLQP